MHCYYLIVQNKIKLIIPPDVYTTWKIIIGEKRPIKHDRSLKFASLKSNHCTKGFDLWAFSFFPSNNIELFRRRVYTIFTKLNAFHLFLKGMDPSSSHLLSPTNYLNCTPTLRQIMQCLEVNLSILAHTYLHGVLHLYQHLSVQFVPTWTIDFS